MERPFTSAVNGHFASIERGLSLPPLVRNLGGDIAARRSRSLIGMQLGTGPDTTEPPAVRFAKPGVTP